MAESRSADFQPGDRAIVLRRAGGWATHVQLPAENLFKLPTGIDPLQAAMLKVNPATAWRLLTGFGTPEPGSWIVQNAANSGVGRCVIAAAKELGVHTINLVRRPELIDELLALGGDVVVTDDEAGLEAAKAASAAKPKLAFNCVGGESALRLMNLLAPGSTHITFGAMARRPITVPNGLLIFKDLQIRGLWITKWIESAPKEELDDAYGKLADLMLGGRIKVPVDSTYPLDAFGAALERVGGEGREGKVLLVP
ncbi:MAG: alcohol dehydrogenase [Verrucomicrobiaceae bacterium]|nr:MAG: alcohol dehydrogenase [Verrucomicrobiaceae bacterium]